MENILITPKQITEEINIDLFNIELLSMPPELIEWIKETTNFVSSNSLLGSSLHHNNHT